MAGRYDALVGRELSGMTFACSDEATMECYGLWWVRERGGRSAILELHPGGEPPPAGVLRLLEGEPSAAAAPAPTAAAEESLEDLRRIDV